MLKGQAQPSDGLAKEEDFRAFQPSTPAFAVQRQEFFGASKTADGEFFAAS